MSRGSQLTGPVSMTASTATQKTKRIYWTTTGVISLVMIFSIYKMFTAGWTHLGFPSYLRIELVVAKALGLIVLWVPGIPPRAKEWAYAGFGIVLVSASVAHASSGDPVANVVEPLVFLGVLMLSNVYWHKMTREQG
jgi:hypothetical protein